MSGKRRICFVCLGNIVRSPLAENLFLHLAKQTGVDDKYEVDSAGTGGWHVGEPPDERMRHVAARRGLHYSGSARKFVRQDFERFDLIIAMDHENRRDLLRLVPLPAQQSKIHLLREFDPSGGGQYPVPDPYYGDVDGFEDVFDIIERSCRGLLLALEEGRLGETV